MWLFTRYGFYSVVRCKRPAKGGFVQFAVRARRREHLEALLELMEEKIYIAETLDSDYGYRVTLMPTQLDDMVIALSGDIDYENFKEECEKCMPRDYCDALHDVWDRMRKEQLPKW